MTSSGSPRTPSSKVCMEAHVEPWRTAISDSDDAHVWIRGHDLASLMTGATFADVVFLLHAGRLPTSAERRVMDAILISIADHGPGAPSAMAARTVASGNRQAPEAAVAAGILAIGDAHAGAGFGCMTLIVDGLGLVQREGMSIDAAAKQIVDEAVAAGRRLPGFGHRTHRREDQAATGQRRWRVRGCAARSWVSPADGEADLHDWPCCRPHRAGDRRV